MHCSVLQNVLHSVLLFTQILHHYTKSRFLQTFHFVPSKQYIMTVSVTFCEPSIIVVSTSLIPTAFDESISTGQE